MSVQTILLLVFLAKIDTIATVVAITLSETLGLYVPFVELFSHFFIFYAPTLALASIVFSVAGMYVWAVVAGILSTLTFIPALIPFFGKPPKNADFLLLNALYTNEEAKHIIQIIREYRPRYVAIVEISASIYRDITEFDGYTSVLDGGDGVLRLAIFVRDDQHVRSAEILQLPYPTGHIETDAEHIYLIHPMPPFSGMWARDQKIQFKEMSERLRTHTERGERTIVLGDFNASFASPIFRYFFGRYYCAPRYSWGLFGIPFLPIDHAVATHPVLTRRERDVGSDHFPIVVGWK